MRSFISRNSFLFYLFLLFWMISKMSLGNIFGRPIFLLSNVLLVFSLLKSWNWLLYSISSSIWCIVFYICIFFFFFFYFLFWWIWSSGFYLLFISFRNFFLFVLSPIKVTKFLFPRSFFRFIVYIYIRLLPLFSLFYQMCLWF